MVKSRLGKNGKLKIPREVMEHFELGRGEREICKWEIDEEDESCKVKFYKLPPRTEIEETHECYQCGAPIAPQDIICPNCREEINWLLIYENEKLKEIRRQ